MPTETSDSQGCSRRRVSSADGFGGVDRKAALEDGEPGLAQAEDGADDMAITNASVRGLQEAVREAVDRGDFREPEVQANGAAKARLESLLSDLTSLKSRLDAVRTAA